MSRYTGLVIPLHQIDNERLPRPCQWLSASNVGKEKGPCLTLLWTRGLKRLQDHPIGQVSKIKTMNSTVRTVIIMGRQTAEYYLKQRFCNIPSANYLLNCRRKRMMRRAQAEEGRHYSLMMVDPVGCRCGESPRGWWSFDLVPLRPQE